MIVVTFWLVRSTAYISGSLKERSGGVNSQVETKVFREKLPQSSVILQKYYTEYPRIEHGSPQ
jgi:hypothetical protein